MKKNKFIPIFLLLFVSFLFTINFASAVLVVSPTLQSPDDDEHIVGTYNINGNFADNSGHNVTQAEFYYRLAYSDAWTLIATVTNESATQTAFNTSWDSTGIVDNTDIEFNITLRNSTDVYDSDNASGVNIDNGVPTATFATASLEQNGAFYMGNAITLSVDADNTIGADNCTVYFTTNANKVNMTATSNACSFSLTEVNFSKGVFGQFDYVIGLRDGNGNETNTSSRRLTVYNAPQGGGGGGSPTIVSTITPEGGEEGVSPGSPSGPSPVGKPFGETISNFFKQIKDFFKDIFGKSS